MGMDDDYRAAGWGAVDKVCSLGRQPETSSLSTRGGQLAHYTVGPADEVEKQLQRSTRITRSAVQHAAWLSGPSTTNRFRRSAARWPSRRAACPSQGSSVRLEMASRRALLSKPRRRSTSSTAAGGGNTRMANEAILAMGDITVWRRNWFGVGCGSCAR
ncbi:hypothetical protein K505DRAFT_344004 [Melanomma pulvis-pyrius CBS 109.77]|uniref:Uncharacterized protein n=1 Tax=Melanomma pulvis-pyrius CBS 109.77 TaxID=1314802 RepID=A0A6A6WQ31_9PLEO|nr:hypothetical protein K505DRAFT_344004 [Melanomma pulvis-pyrius CBS 109.77]